MVSAVLVVVAQIGWVCDLTEEEPSMVPGERMTPFNSLKLHNLVECSRTLVLYVRDN